MQATTPPAGYSADTEILTRHGWMTFPQLTYMSEVATRSPDGRFEWQYPEKITCEPYDGEMVAFANKSMDLLVAPGHGIVIRRPEYHVLRHPNAEGKDWHVRAAGVLALTPWAPWEVPATSRWVGDGPAEFVIPGWKADRRHPAHEQAAEWLLGYLTSEWTPSAQVAADAKAAGIGENALKIGRNLIGAPMRRRGSTRSGKGVSWWETGKPTRPLVKGNGHYTPMREFRLPMRAFCAFIGIYLAEGWCRKDRNDVIISQMPTSRHLPEIWDILNATGLVWNYDARNGKFTTSHKTLAPWLRASAGYRAWGKYVPPGFMDYPADVLEAMMRGMMIGDGHWEKRDQQCYTTTSVRLADEVQEIFQKIGIDAWIRPQDLSKYTGGTFGGPRRLSYVVRERLQETHWLAKASRSAYEGHVWTVTVPNGVVYVRRSLRATWCGTGHAD